LDVHLFAANGNAEVEILFGVDPVDPLIELPVKLTVSDCKMGFPQAADAVDHDNGIGVLCIKIIFSQEVEVTFSPGEIAIFDERKVGTRGF
jgi:hypothetical protein